jgi:hypothetical protein
MSIDVLMRNVSCIYSVIPDEGQDMFLNQRLFTSQTTMQTASEDAKCRYARWKLVNKPDSSLRLLECSFYNPIH